MERALIISALLLAVVGGAAWGLHYQSRLDAPSRAVVIVEHHHAMAGKVHYYAATDDEGNVYFAGEVKEQLDAGAMTCYTRGATDQLAACE